MNWTPTEIVTSIGMLIATAVAAIIKYQSWSRQDMLLNDKWIEKQRIDLFNEMKQKLEDLDCSLKQIQGEHIKCEKDRVVTHARLEEQLNRGQEMKLRIEALERKVESLIGDK